MNDKQKTLMYAWLLLAAILLSLAVLVRLDVPFPVLIVFVIFLPFSKKLGEKLKDDQDRSFKEYYEQHKKIFIGSAIFTAITFLYAMVNLMLRSNARLSQQQYVLIFVPFIPWLLLGVGQQIYLYKQYGRQT